MTSQFMVGAARKFGTSSNSNKSFPTQSRPAGGKLPLESRDSGTGQSPGRAQSGTARKAPIPCRSTAGEVCFSGFVDEETEALAVIGQIAALTESGEISAGDVAILFRTNEQPRLFETELRRRRVRYVLIGGQSFYSRREIRDMLAYLKVIARPDDEASLLRIINVPARGIGDATVEKLTARAVRLGRGIWDIVPDASAAGEISSKARGALDALQSLLDRFRHDFEEAPARLAELYQRLVDEIGYEAEIDRMHDEPEQQLARRGAIEQLREAIATYAERTASPTLAGFLDDSALVGRDEERDSDPEMTANSVKLMTLHSAKGLEFPRVYLVGLEEGLLPHRRSLEASEASIAEERRLAYVGVTRARNDLTVTWAESRKKWGKPRPSLVSRFVHEMRDDPDETTETSAESIEEDGHPRLSRSGADGTEIS